MIVLLLLAHALPAMADDDEWPAGSAMATGKLHIKTRTHFEELLAKEQERLIDLVSKSVDANSADERLVNALKALDGSWRQFREAECETFGALTGAGGSWPSTYAVECEAAMTEQRFKRVRAANRCIDRTPEADRWPFSARHCLNQLLTFNIK